MTTEHKHPLRFQAKAWAGKLSEQNSKEISLEMLSKALADPAYAAIELPKTDMAAVIRAMMAMAQAKGRFCSNCSDQFEKLAKLHERKMN